MEDIRTFDDNEETQDCTESTTASHEKQKKKKKKKSESKERKTGDPLLFKMNAVSAEKSEKLQTTGDTAYVDIKSKDSSSAGKSRKNKERKERTTENSGEAESTNSPLPRFPRRRITHKTLSGGFYSEHDTDDTLLDHGEIQFTGYENHVGGRSHYIRVTRKTDPAVIWEVLIEEWELSLPDLVISVTGGLKFLQMGPKLRERFKRGLIQTATTTGAWIITGGTSGRIMEFIGEAVRDHLIISRGRRRIVTIGIPTYGYVRNKQAFRNKKCKLRDAFEPLYNNNYIANYDQKDAKNATDGKYDLEHNHTHFIMVDSEQPMESCDDFECEIGLRASFEKMINNHAYFGNQTTQSHGNKIPVIQIVIGGGSHAVQGVAESLKNNIPVIVVAGSGRAADLIAHEFQKPEKKTKETIAEMLSDQKDKMKISEGHTESFIESLTVVFSEKYSHLLTVFNIADVETKDFESAVLNALLKAKEANTIAKLALALAWNRSDIAEEKILKGQNLENVLGDIDDLMVKAMVQNKHEFVRLFLERGIEASRYVDKYNMWNLYSNCLHFTSDKAVEMLHSMLSKLQRPMFASCTCRPLPEVQPDHRDLLKFIGKVVEALLFDGELNPYPDLIKNRVEEQEYQTAYIKKEADIQKVGEQEALQTLFLWAVLFNRKDMALQFWKILPRHNIVASLVASSMLRQMSKYAEHIEELDLSKSLSYNSGFFENLAFEVLTECYEYDKDLSHKLLVQKNYKYGKTTILFLADSNHQMDFMGHTCCQSLLRRLWKGKIALHVPTLQIILTLICPVLVPFIKFSTSERTWGEPREDNIFDLPKKRFYNVSIFGNSNKRSISFPRAVFYFYFAPITIFWSNLLAYLIFLGIFSLFVLTELHPNHFSTYEYITYGWIVSVILEEFRQITAVKKDSFKYKLRTWCHGEWNRFDMIDNMFFTVSFILRFSVSADNFVWARMTFSVTLALYVLRFLELFFVSENLGPKVIMIRRMLNDLMLFFLILAVFVLSFGLAYQANLYPNALANWDLLKQIVYHPYFQIYGELFLDNMEGNEPSVCSKNETEWKYGNIQRCPEQNALVVLLLAAYMLATNILLVNLLIAMFAHTFNTVQENSRQIWRFYRCSLVYKYCDRPVLVPPFIVISHIIRLFRSIAMKCCRICTRRNEFRKKFLEEESNAIALFEREAVEEYLHKRDKIEKQNKEKSVTNTKEYVANLMTGYEKNNREIKGVKEIFQQQTDEIRDLRQNISEILQRIDMSLPK